MAWSAVPTFVAGNVLTASQMNILGGNLNETAVAIATTAGGYFTATGSNALAQRICDSDVVDSIATTTNTSYVHSSMPTVNLTTGTKALVMMYSYINNNTNSQTSFYTSNITGTTTSNANDNRAISAARFTSDFAVACSAVVMFTGITAGSGNVFTAGVRVTGGTGTWDHRRIAVFPF